MNRHLLKIYWTLLCALLLLSGLGAASAHAQDWCARRHYVVSGDTLSYIARWYGTTVAELQRLNGLTNVNRIYRGTWLCVRGAVYTPPPVSGRVYVVQPGDTLARISRWYGVDMWSLARANSILNLNHIFVGQRLIIP
jgi:LysM repeat protein